MTDYRFPVALVVLSLSMVPSAAAQETRAAEIAAEQARKAAEITPYVPSKAERWQVQLSAWRRRAACRCRRATIVRTTRRPSTC